ncbi:MAG: chromosome segregation protein SMC [Acidobacteriaceae bacterium]|nr:chromosome segregation protein SMC [Acidobacteriaceae bacterium]
MLKLKRVEIHGFKSFYDRTEMKFKGSGIAAVVGPNGCGKSNLSDAISWVLGEQSAKTLRGTRMEDVIFAGTREKKPLGMASVTMTLVPDEQAVAAWTLPSPAPSEQSNAESSHHLRNGIHSQKAVSILNGTYASGGPHAEPPVTEATKSAHRLGEITITRRLYRSGESEYLIDGKTARLRDIQDLFLGTGLGPESYAIIEQGRIGQILSNKPQDRRAVIEEAAGITKFKTRKRLAEAKLESAKQNLARVFDILEEVNRQVNSLKRQASKTKRYSELTQEASAYLRQILAARFQILEREAAKVAIELNLALAELQNAQSDIAEREAKQTGLLQESYAIEQELTAARKLLADLNLEAERARSKLGYQSKQIQQIEARLTSGEQEAESLAGQQRELMEEAERQAAEFQTIDVECTTAREQLEAKACERQQAQNRVFEQERRLETARQAVLRLLGESSALKNRITQFEEQIASADRDTARAQAEELQSKRDQARLQEQRANLSEQLAARQTALLSITEQRTAIERDLQQKRSELHESRQALDRLRSEHSRLKARKDSIEEIIEHRSYTTETVKRLFAAVEHGNTEDFRPVGVLADFLEVDPQLEKAIEEFLHDELEHVVVRDWAEAERGVELMRRDLNGRATFLVEQAGESGGSFANLPLPSTESGTLTPLGDSLKLTNGLSNLSLELLPRIANCFVTPDRVQARELAARFPHCWFLTPEGINYHGSAVSGGKKSGAGPLALKRELREISLLESSKQREATEAQLKLTNLESAISTLSEQQERLRSQQQSQEKDVLALDHESRKLAEELQRLQSRLSNACLELDRIRHDRVKVIESLERDRQNLAEREQARAEQENELASARETLSLLQAETARAAEEYATVRANLAGLEERRRALSLSHDRIVGQLQNLSDRQVNLANESTRLRAEGEQFLASNAELEMTSKEVQEAIVSAEANVSHLVQNETEFRERIAACDEELKKLRALAQSVQDRRSELQVTLARAESDLKHLEETCEKELHSSMAQLAEGIETIPSEEALQELEAKHESVRQKIESLGPVNPQALEEFEESQQRQEFLSAQRQDLLDSIRDTEKAIQEIDTESRKRFGEAFHAINAHFRELFTTLFGGGTGEMRLTDEENLAESGIDIVASPPGKRLQSVLLLSGGEKSLTAMALLMAIFRYTPSPFCVLDEVDAPLDEPNIERLTRLLRGMAEQTQFIVITHSKRTMESAQALYGVTMQEPGVSKLVSVKFKNEEPELTSRPRQAELLEAATV